MSASAARWSSRVSFYLATIGAAVGIGSIWRFPYLVGTQGGSAFVLVFVLACVAIAIPLLAAEFLIGRRARLNPMQAAGAVAAGLGRSRAWNAIGVCGTLAVFVIMSYYTLIAGWILAYAWKCTSGRLVGLDVAAVRGQWAAFLASPVQMVAWHWAFLALVGWISMRGVNRGLEVANRWRAPALLALLVVLVAYALATGDVAHGLAFAFAPDFGRIDGQVMLSAVGQAFFATGAGLAMMIAYGAYAPADSSLIRSAVLIVVSIVAASALASMVVFPLVFRFGLDPAQGPDLVFIVLPAAFAAMPGGRLVGSLFFVLLVLAALTPSIAGIEPVVAWLEQRTGIARPTAVVATLTAGGLLGLGSVLSFNVLAHWHPLGALPGFQSKTFFDTIDYLASNVLAPLGTLLTALFVGWRVPRAVADEAFGDSPPAVRRAIRLLLRWVCPVAIVVIGIASLF